MLIDEKKDEKSLRSFFWEEQEELKDVYESEKKLLGQFQLTVDLTRQLQDFFKSKQQEKMNDALLALTLVITTLTPIQVLTGIYGMNFDHFPELSFKYAYPCWWLLVLMLTTFLHRGFFSWGYFQLLPAHEATGNFMLLIQMINVVIIVVLVAYLIWLD